MIDPCSKCYTLIFPYVDHLDIRDLPDSEMTLPKIKKFMIQILKVYFIGNGGARECS